ncbi:activator of 2-hydroxyglutaryl-CoA dehydratase [Candidatus Scalindua japonica]|uniref:Activator of 2-hydroxyglutaryl-CoA dehydratase n=1 Tax=Candidatus Scalindua japonica TaxID=1284222 RepID=A0A286TTH0_9BACT|nr:acyl-CoA dehydratase activase [Candidatus Scalindua japonica]GAX59163.1 activator of 2-hydroxyglutaryl-CoA dehydratase [Candidatus Scalindua japonica]
MYHKKDKRNGESVPYFEGLEIGTVSVKWVRRIHNGKTISIVERHEGKPRETIQRILDRHKCSHNSRIAATGQASRSLTNLPYFSETECIEKSMLFHNLNPDMVLSLGGETFNAYPMKDGKIKDILSSSKCASGTGEFIVQQFKRIGLSLSEGLEESKKGNCVPIATRCSVHCKSDVTHKLNQKECSVGDITHTLIHDLAAKVYRMVELSQWSTDLIVICGQVALNEPFIEKLRGLFVNSNIIVLPESPYIEAFGASLFASELPENTTGLTFEKWFKESMTEFEKITPLSEAEQFLDYRVRTESNKQTIIDNESYILGVDAGSTTTKAVLLPIDDGVVAASCYLRTLGNPVQATKNCLLELIKQRGNKSIRIIQTAVTGSGREIVSVYLDNCFSFNEILAHARAASEELPDVETVFEIGGQDSKFISFLNGNPVDYAMNEGCSAGTGSFIEESASIDMGIEMENISNVARKSTQPISFGERCAAFINTDIRNALQQEADQEDVIAGLVYSIADNYISRIVGPRHIGNNLMFMGGVALNRSVALAIASRVQQKVVVPPHPELMGSVGSALMARDLLRDGDAKEEHYKLEDIIKNKINEKESFRCKSCENNCEIKRIETGGKIYPFGGLCSKYEKVRHKDNTIKEGRDLVAVWNEMMFKEFGPHTIKNARGTIGLPMALTAYNLFPYFTKLINELGYNIILSNPSKEGKKKTRSPICYPCEIYHGAVYDLIDRNVDYILMPRVIELGKDSYSYTCPSTSAIPDIIRKAFPDLDDKVLSPSIWFSNDYNRITSIELEKLSPLLGLEKDIIKDAGQKALSHYNEYMKQYQKRSKAEFEKLKNKPTIILAGRPYVTCSSEVNFALPRKIASMGYHVVPADMVPQFDGEYPERDVWHHTRQIDNAIAYAKNNADFYLCFISCFSCGPDACMYHYFRDELQGHTFCYLEIDSHTAYAGFETRLSAFFDIINAQRRKKRRLKSREQNTDTINDLEFKQARFTENYQHIIDSDNKRIKLNDPRITHVITYDFNHYSKLMMKGIFNRYGVNCRINDKTSAEIIQYGKKMCSGRECFPFIAITGFVLKDLYENRREDEITLCVNLNMEGPCQYGSWPAIGEVFVKKLNLKNFMFSTQWLPENKNLGLKRMHSIEIIRAIILGHFLEEAKNALICVAQNKESALSVFDKETDRLVEYIKSNKHFIPALKEWAIKMAEIPRKISLEEMPKVLIIGGLNLLFVHYPVSEFFLEQGVIPKVVDFTEGILWLFSKPVLNFSLQRGVSDLKEQFSFTSIAKGALTSLFNGNRKNAFNALQNRITMAFIEKEMKRLRKIMLTSNLMFDVHIPFLDIIQEGNKHISYNAFSETPVTTGRYICSIKTGVYDALINLGCFNCQPAMNAHAIVRPLANKNDIPYAALDVEGPTISTNQRRLLETIAIQAKRNKSDA